MAEPNVLVSIVTPVHNRRDELRRCLASLQAQTYRNFEAIVVDDASTIDVKSIVDEVGDPRFIYVRNAKNGGPYNARTLGWQRARGEYLIHLDSDDEACPWLVERVVQYMAETPAADAVAGMYVREPASSISVRVRGGTLLVTPDDVADLPAVPDCIAGVRRNVVEEWLARSHDYFALEGHAWLTFSLTHSQLYVDEVWARCHLDAADRVSDTLLRSTERTVRDCLLFLADYDQVLRTVQRRDVDRMLFTILRVFVAARHLPGARKTLEYIRIRGARSTTAIARLAAAGLLAKVRRRLLPGAANRTIWLGLTSDRGDRA